MSNRQFPFVDAAKRRKPKNTPWATYNPAWIKSHQRRPKSVGVSKRSK